MMTTARGDFQDLSDDDEAAQRRAGNKHAASTQSPAKNNDGEADDKDKDNAEGDDKKKKKILKKRSTKPRLDEAKLLDDKVGVPYVVRTFPKIEFQPGRSNDAGNLRLLLGYYRAWSEKIFPNVSYHDFVERVEKLGGTRKVKDYVKGLRIGLEEHRLRTQEAAESDVDADGNSKAPANGNGSTTVDPDMDVDFAALGDVAAADGLELHKTSGLSVVLTDMREAKQAKAAARRQARAERERSAVLAAAASTISGGGDDAAEKNNSSNDSEENGNGDDGSSSSSSKKKQQADAAHTSAAGNNNESRGHDSDNDDMDDFGLGSLGNRAMLSTSSGQQADAESPRAGSRVANTEHEDAEREEPAPKPASKPAQRKAKGWLDSDSD